MPSALPSQSQSQSQSQYRSSHFATSSSSSSSPAAASALRPHTLSPSSSSSSSSSSSAPKLASPSTSSSTGSSTGAAAAAAAAAPIAPVAAGLPSPSPSLQQVQSITNLAQVHALIATLEAEGVVIEQDLDALLGQRDRIEAKLETLQFLAPKLQVLENDAKQLHGTISFTCRLAENVSGKVRELDGAQSNVRLCIKRVEDILDLKNCVEGVQSALARGDFESAAKHIHSYQSIDPALLSAAESTTSATSAVAAALGDDGALDSHREHRSPVQALQEAERVVRVTIAEKFAAAASAVASGRGSTDEITRFFVLFPLINLHEDGLEKLSAFVCGQVVQLLDGKFRELSRNENGKLSQVVFVDLFVQLFTAVAKTVDQYQPIIEEHYGFGYLSVLLRRLQFECDRQAQKILNVFMTERDFRKKVREVQAQMTRVQKASATTNDAIDPRDVDIQLVEIALFSSHTQSYNKYMRKHAEDDTRAFTDASAAESATLSSQNGPLLPSIASARLNFERFMDACELNKLMHELVGNYIVMEEFYMKHSVLKAITMDKHEPGTLTSSGVDDVFYVLKKCTRRALSSGNVNIVCAMINHANTIIDSDLKADLQAKLRANVPSVSSDLKEMFQSRLTFDVGSTAAALRATYMVLLNNTEVSSEYTVKLMKGLEQESLSLFTLESEQKKLESLLSDMASTGNSLRHLLQSAMEQFFFASLLPRIKTALDALSSVSYVIDDQAFADNDVSDPFVVPFVNELQALIMPLRSMMTDSNYDSLVGIVAQYVTAQMEARIFDMSFNALGGIQLDKDLRALTGYFSGMTQKTVRDRFTRLHQICSLLLLERVQDAVDHWNSQLSWRLTPSEVLKVLGLRVDFKKEEVQRVRL
ncbi:hypothetical protein CAOG_05793 [Capsaspora owczarzaki ATCC 30864]|uniref:hypothetical protein n=1 Tax=Capsaspora owczarzaki (strain ATCC 30864) TaxID=595528 RepID=UPI0003524052|nr:hypothetical protein CAOG_05793 [Capsaspora owczarzaki ATCC 30864]|eukprot:XP_004346466.2 hypothetical protein CAOG_05793 [Capsaspora owczarzaki ATCC 30864]